jgi:hypothetical protein
MISRIDVVSSRIEAFQSILMVRYLESIQNILISVHIIRLFVLSPFLRGKWHNFPKSDGGCFESCGNFHIC